ncbi:MAG: electron transfer flavoprotein subunit alpha/FixB family protein [Bacilli bacterium]|jgi:electron transfer flavoprotein alpha subunit|nr:electron transfer flavoprotein subunit alpha/FixB family protein [Bacilli bacterium]HHU24858.1 electron transfer flavoprotein subunit alpha/FixB family protein [Acholeplasmataceae bacterium]
MGKLVIDQKKVSQEVADKLIKLCPFGGFEYDGKILGFTAGCRVCKLCVRKGPEDVVKFVEDDLAESPKINKDEWKGVTVFIEHDETKVHPVAFELIGKAQELAQKTNQEVLAVLIASNEQAKDFEKQILSYGVDKLYIYAHDLFTRFLIEPYTAAMEDFINKIKPNTVLYGGTALGRSFAPRVAARFKTGLTADCTVLDMKENGDLVQIRPAFGGNVMAQIITPSHRPQMATVRYKMFRKKDSVEPHGKTIYMDVDNIDLTSRIQLLDIFQKPKSADISEADVIVACGRIFKTPEDLAMAEELAQLLGGIVAVTRPLVEEGIKDAKYQIGLSGRTVSPKLIINLGISGAVQYTAGMNSSETIISINKDPNASIFGVSHYGIVGDVFEIVPELIKKLKTERKMG